MTGIKDVTLTLGECQKPSPAVASPFMCAISPAGAPSRSFPQEVPLSGSIAHHAAFVALSAFHSL